jgi:phosphohistidine phosphatase
MKELYIIRHAKSSWKDITLSDFDRPLNKRGKHNSIFMGELLASRGVVPDVIVSSSAKRAYTTSKNIAKAIGYSKQKIYFNSDIYEASLNTLIHVITAIDNEHESAFLIGHNPSLNMLLDYLVPDNTIENIVTTGVVELELSIERWEELSAKRTKLISFEYPKKYL